jgi:hypothetical protein
VSGRYGRRALAQDAPEWLGKLGRAINPMERVREERAAKERTRAAQAKAHAEWKEYYRKEAEKKAAAEAEKKRQEAEKKAARPGILSRVGRAINPLSRLQEEREATARAKKAVYHANKTHHEERSHKDRQHFAKITGKGGQLEGVGKRRYT